MSCLSIGFSDNDLDCNDGDATVNTNASELIADGIDQNCDGLECVMSMRMAMVSVGPMT